MRAPLLQKQFGDGGTGFVLIARPWAWYNHRGVEMDANSSWKIDIAGATAVKDGMHGLGGVSFVGSAGRDRALARQRAPSRRRDRVSHAARRRRVRGRCRRARARHGGNRGATAKSARLRVIQHSRTARQKFAVRVTEGAVRLYGAEFRRRRPGVIYSSLGINGANVTLLSQAFNGHALDRRTAPLQTRSGDRQLRHQRKRLPGIRRNHLGSGNEEVVPRLHAALPDTSDSADEPHGSRRAQTGRRDRDHRRFCRSWWRSNRSVAAETGMAFFNTFEAMGGEGTMARWYAAEPRLVGADFIHPMPAGAKIVGELLYNALRDGYNQYKLRQLKSHPCRLLGNA